MSKPMRTPSGSIKVACIVLRPPDIVADGLPKLRCGVIGEEAPPVSVLPWLHVR